MMYSQVFEIVVQSILLIGAFIGLVIIGANK